MPPLDEDWDARYYYAFLIKKTGIWMTATEVNISLWLVGLSDFKVFGCTLLVPRQGWSTLEIRKYKKILTFVFLADILP